MCIEFAQERNAATIKERLRAIYNMVVNKHLSFEEALNMQGVQQEEINDTKKAFQKAFPDITI